MANDKTGVVMTKQNIVIIIGMTIICFLAVFGYWVSDYLCNLRTSLGDYIYRYIIPSRPIYVQIAFVFLGSIMAISLFLLARKILKLGNAQERP